MTIYTTLCFLSNGGVVENASFRFIIAIGIAKNIKTDAFLIAIYEARKENANKRMCVALTFLRLMRKVMLVSIAKNQKKIYLPKLNFIGIINSCTFCMHNFCSVNTSSNMLKGYNAPL